MILTNQTQIRAAQIQDWDALKQLWAYCFSDSASFREWYFDEYYKMDECLVATVDGKVAASLQVITEKMIINNETVRSGYIVGVDCFPEYRGLGLTRQLMEEALTNFAEKNNIQFMLLMPFEADFYYQYGFHFASFHANMQISIEEFYRKLGFDKQAYSWIDVNKANFEDYTYALSDVYKNWMKRFDGSIQRTKRHWNSFCQDIFIENGYIKLLQETNGNYAGYLAYTFHEGQLYIKEMAYIHEQSRAFIYYFVASHRSQVKQVQWSAPEDEWLVYNRLKDKNAIAIQPFMMYRILDPTIAALFAHRLPSRDSCFAVNDEVFLWEQASKQIRKVDKPIDEVAITLTMEQFNRLILNRNFDWYSLLNHEPSQEERAFCELFSRKMHLFVNEYY